jgi:hypothetical protein
MYIGEKAKALRREEEKSKKNGLFSSYAADEGR